MGKIFDYAVKYRGKYYPPNTPIEETTTDEATTEVEENQEAPQKAAKGRKKGDD
jgi:hypothetical protein